MNEHRTILAALTILVTVGLTSACTSAPTIQQSTTRSPAPTVPSITGSIVTDDLIPDDSTWVNALPTPTNATMMSADVASTGVSMPWKFLAFGTQNEVIEVAYVAGDGSCVLPEGFFAAALGDGVVLAAVSHQTDEQACSDKAVVGRAWVTLPKLVSSRAPLSHAPVDAQWTAPGFFD